MNALPYRGMKLLITTMPDGSEWGVDINEIAMDRAKHYADEFDGDVERSLDEDTLPLFEGDEYEIEDWATNNMNWKDFSHHYLIRQASKIDYQEGWLNGQKEIKQY